MRLLQRIGRLERKVGARNDKYAHLADEELQARIVQVANELQASGPLDSETETFLKANGLWLGDELPSTLKGESDDAFRERCVSIVEG